VEERIRRRARHARGAPATDPVSPAPAELGAALGGGALVEYVETGGLLYAVVLAAGRTRLHELGPVGTVEGELAALRFGLRRLAFRVGSPQSLAAATELVASKAARLDELLLEPLRSEAGDRPLVIVPTGALHATPWPALPSCRGRSVSVAPSAALWQRAATTPGTSGGRCVLVAGPDLPHGAAEVAALARRYPRASRFTGRNARVAPVTAALDGAELAHIAAHGHFRADNPLFSALRLVDGPLTVYDLEQLKRPPRHVVLSACDSGLPAVQPGDELLGLTAALLALGTRSLVATVVPVPDKESRPVMLRFHRHLLTGLGPAAALAATQRELASATATSFVCFGAG
jgi:CHAT domain-containing protein